MTTTLLTPVDRSKARPSGASLWRKQLLPIGTIDYKGRQITFSREYLTGLVKSFTDKAYDTVPFQFADGANTHTNAPEQRRGTVRDLELTDDGLDIIVEAGPDAAKHLAEYPDLGVSARIVEAYDRSDGRHFPAAIQHVLGTLDPRITGMRPWQAIDAANDAGDILDLTALEYAESTDPGPAVAVPAADTTPPETAPAPKETRMAFTPEQEARLAKLLDLPDDKFDKMLTTATADEPEGEQLSDEELERLIASLPDAEPEAEPEAEAKAEPAPEAEPEKVPVGASLSVEAQAAIDLANTRAEETSLELARVTSALNRAAYEKERDHYSREYGIPPRITDLARPVLEGEGHVVDLANGQVDAGAIVRKVLKEIGQTVKMLDLSGEMGSPLDGGRDAERAAEEQTVKDRGAFVKRFRETTGV